MNDHMLSCQGPICCTEDGVGEVLNLRVHSISVHCSHSLFITNTSTDSANIPLPTRTRFAPSSGFQRLLPGNLMKSLPLLIVLVALEASHTPKTNAAFDHRSSCRKSLNTPVHHIEVFASAIRERFTGSMLYDFKDSSLGLLGQFTTISFLITAVTFR